MKKEELYQIIREVLASTFKERDSNTNYALLDIDEDLFQTIQMNSLLSIEVLARLENILELEFDDESLTSDQVRTIRGIAELCMLLIKKS